MFRIKMAVLVLAVVSVACSSLDTIAQSSATFTLQLNAPICQIKSGQNLLMIITMTNTSDHNIKMYAGVPWPFYRLVVQDQSGSRAKETPYGMKAHGTDPNLHFNGSAGTTYVESGMDVTDKIELTKEYDLSVPGLYKVSASRMDPETHTVVKSNEIQITVLAK